MNRGMHLLSAGALVLSGLGTANADEGELIIATPDGDEVLHLNAGDESSGVKTLGRGEYILKISEPGTFILKLAGPTRLEILPEGEKHKDQAEHRPSHKEVETSGPVYIDFDLDGDDQEQRVLEISSDTEKVEIQLVGHDLPAVYGYSVNVAYDPEALSFDNTSFKPGPFIAGLIPLLLPAEGSVEAGGANFTKQTNSGDGDLGSLAFDVLDGFDGETVLKITKVSLRTPDETQTVEDETYAKIVGLGSGKAAAHEEHEEHDAEKKEEHGDHDKGEHALSGQEAIKTLMEEGSCPNCDLHGANLMREDFNEADLSGADLSGANLFFSNLTGADLSGADLTKANLLQAKLREADLSGANLTGARLTGAQLQKADLTDADLTGAPLSGANLTGAIWTDGSVCGPASIGRCR